MLNKPLLKHDKLYYLIVKKKEMKKILSHLLDFGITNPGFEETRLEKEIMLCKNYMNPKFILTEFRTEKCWFRGDIKYEEYYKESYRLFNERLTGIVDRFQASLNKAHWKLLKLELETTLKVYNLYI